MSVEQTTFRPLQRYEQIAERLAADIRSGLYAPSERLPSERELARTLEVSRASVREALAALQLQGVVETRKGAGTFVSARPPAPDEAPHDASPSAVLEARAQLEPAVARLAAARAQRDEAAERLLAAMEAEPVDIATWNASDRLFHRQLAAMTGNPVLLAFADHVATLMDQPLWQRLRDDSIATAGRTRIHVAEHRMIYEAIVAGDGDAAAFYSEQHINRVRAYMELS
ncbi:FadR family transcriptional regulator [Solirubrobacter sp. CPCC 204708]|uniref:FadR family transcriptional regulator n=1 Tax=Solirubrobacter deserti TaxID=2282478 RepID=A0ABT4RBV8_9ACTN|nr:FadR/GntR family transcriptional regulator [Solirubrobacter deserti]MBE2317086.1 FadR family transcriptional regulator [Solirubrobacter deserti]MDA0136022.1 FadR family transcriptional regulator [Solirubrobacter deserti]